MSFRQRSFTKIPVDRCLSVVGRQAFAGPAVAPEARGEKVAQQIGLVAVLRVAAGVADKADAAQRSAVVDQGRDRDGKTVGLGAGILLHLRQQVVGLGPVFEFVVIAEVDFPQPVRLRPAAPDLAPAVERRRRRPAIGAAGIVDELVGQCLDLRSEPQIPDFASRRPVACAVVRRRKGRRCAHQPHRGESGRKAGSEALKQTARHGGAIRHARGA